MSTDEGNSWNAIFDDTISDKYVGIHSIYINNNNDIFISLNYENGIIMKTTNNGKEWLMVYQYKDSLYDGPFKLLHGYESVIYALGEHNICFSIDDGNNWNEIDKSIIRLKDGFGINHINGDIFVFQHHQLLKSTNCGNNWDLIVVGLDLTFIGSRNMKIFDSKKFFVDACNGNSLMKTTDGGFTWKNILDYEHEIYTYELYGKNIFCAYDDKFVYSTDLGESWNSIPKFTDKEEEFKIRAICFSDKYIFVSANNKTLYRCELNTFPVKVNELDNLNDLSLNAFPNPFSDKLNIEINSGDLYNAKISIHDIFGSEIQRFNNEYMQQVQNRLVWEAKNIPAGVYILSVSNGKETSRLKIIKSE
jgi:hypothetical protein